MDVSHTAAAHEIKILAGGGKLRLVRERHLKVEFREPGDVVLREVVVPANLRRFIPGGLLGGN